MRTIDDVWTALRQVMDPEIPTTSLVDLGIITGVDVQDNGSVDVTMTPTFVGCPAIEMMKVSVEQCLRELGFSRVRVSVSLDIAWSTNRITDEGRAALLKHGLAPPETYEGALHLDVLNNIACPCCGSRDTTMASPFGPTLCRSLHSCRRCGEAFEAFKPV